MDTDADRASADVAAFMAAFGVKPSQPVDAADEEARDALLPDVAGSGSGVGLRGVKQRLLVVANRLPVSAKRRGEEQWSLNISAGGVVSALLGVKEVDAKWIGWAGIDVPDEVGQRSFTKALAEMRCTPVFLDEETANQYYNGYSNNVLWPLIHYLGLPQEDRLEATRDHEAQYDAYKRANKMFADVVIQHYREGDVIWIHDFHLMLLPKYLKEHDANMKVGWFHHSPFPSSDVYRMLPARSELLRSVLCADVVGLHTYDFARHFISSCTKILGLEGTPEGVESQGKLTRVVALPIGIDCDRFTRAPELPAVKKHISEFAQRFAGRKVMLGVERLDMIKGIKQKILGFELFLEENPDWVDKVVLIQIAVPSRTAVPEYQKLKSQVHEIVGRINGRFGTLTSVPIHHLDRSVDFSLLCALYAVTDVALVTSLRDGMNLVSYEYVACQGAEGSKKGVLILSEFAGAAQSLGAGALLVNPWNITEVASSIKQALTMTSDEREKRHRHNYDHVTTHTVQDWAQAFLCELNNTVAEAQRRSAQVPPVLPARTAVERYLHSKNRLIILGFSETMTEQVRGGDQIKEMELKLHPKLKGPLRALCDDEKTTVVVLSGSGRSVLDENFGEFNLWLAAEHGMFLRRTDGKWMTTMPEHLNMDWVHSVKHVVEYFTARTPGSHFEHRETTLVWNYKYADVQFGRLQARDMLQYLWTGPIASAAVDVVQGSRSVEIRSAGVTKGAAIDRILGEIVHSKSMATPIDYVLCVGHFLSMDEDIYDFFDPNLPSKSKMKPNGESSLERKSQPRIQRTQSAAERASSAGHSSPNARHQEGLSVLDLKGESYFSCAVGKERSNARYLLNSSEDVVSFLKDLSHATANGVSANGGS